jgi:ketosteroid isomerase-like protein
LDVTTSLSDHDAIRQVATRYARGVDRLDADVMKSAYWPEATDDHGVFVGNAMVFCDRVVETHKRFAGTMHCNMNHAIEVNGDQASGEIYNVTYLFRVEGDVHYTDTWFGRYLDQYEKRSGEWRIIERICVHENTMSQVVDAHMPIDAAKFRNGSADRGTNTPLGH